MVTRSKPFVSGAPRTRFRSAGAIAVAAVAALAGCGGASEDGGDATGGGGTPIAATGEYYYSSVTGETIQSVTNDPWAVCGGDRYYETDWAVVFGDGGVPDDSKADVAQAIHHHWSQVLSAFAMTEADFQDRYRHIILERYLMAASPYLYNGSLRVLDASDVLDGSLPADLDTREPNEWQRLVHGVAIELSTLELKQLVEDSAAAVGEDPGTFLDLTAASGLPHSVSYEPVKIVACIDSDTPSGSGTGMNWGIAIGPEARDDIIHHELVHYAQARLLGGAPYAHAPRWFTEGQATFLADQHIAGSHNFSDLNPVEIEGCAPPDWGVCAGDERYDLYGLSYKYIAEGTPVASIKALMQDAYTTQEAIERFKRRFGEYIKKPDGSPLTYEEYQHDYELLLKAYF